MTTPGDNEVVNFAQPLAGRVAVIVGAGRGIGRSLAIALGAAGADLMLSARTESDLVETVDLVEAAGGRGGFVLADASDPDGAREPVRTAIRRHGHLDILVNNVGGRVPGNHDPLHCDPAIVGEELALNLLPAWHSSHEALPTMTERGYGRILNIGSGASRFSGSRIGYTVAKHALVGLTLSIAAAVGTRGITVNCLCPGWTDTSMHDWDAMALEQDRTPAEVRMLAESASMQRRILPPEELAGMAVLLASDFGGRPVTGQVIGVDGGFRI